MSNYRDGLLQRGAPVGKTSRAVSLTADNQVVLLQGCARIDLVSDSATATSRTFTVESSTMDGQELELCLISGSSTSCELADSGNMKLAGAWLPLQYDVLLLAWNTNASAWVEQGRAHATGLPDIALASAHILVGNSSGLAADVALSGLVGVTNTGVSSLVLADGKIYVGNGSNVAVAVTASGDVTNDNTGVMAIGAAKVTEAMLKTQQLAGLHAARIAHCIFDPSAVSGDRTIAAHTLGATIPDKAFVTGVWYWVETTFTSATDAGTIALSVQAANDVVTATAISAGGDIWDTTALPVEGVTKIETTSTFLKTTAARAVTATVAIEALTAGKMHVWVQYFVYA